MDIQKGRNPETLDRLRFMMWLFCTKVRPAHFLDWLYHMDEDLHRLHCKAMEEATKRKYL